MFDSATLNHAARVLGEISPELPADAALRRYLRLAHRLGPREKRAVSRAVFNYFRWLQWLDQRESLQKQLQRAGELHERFVRNPKSVKPETLAVRAVPAWLRDEMNLPPEFLQHLQREPTLWLRARPGSAAQLAKTLGHCEPAGAVAPAGPGSESPGHPPTRLARSADSAGRAESQSDRRHQALAESRPPELGTLHSDPESRHPLATLATDALRYTGPQDLFLTPAFHAGAFEIQDLASQLVAIAAAPQPRETWWDTCAGEGGKTLHLADLMDNKGLIWATDRSARRLETLKRRAARAHLFNFRTAGWDGSSRLPTKTKFDGILVDAPCSGVGTWQRNPHARWTTSLDDVHELAALQLALLNHVADSLKSGGRLIYAVCTLTRSETTAVADAFSAAHPDFVPLPLFAQAAGVADPGPVPPSREPSAAVMSASIASAESIATSTGEPHLSTLNPQRSSPSPVFLWPQQLGANGMFIAGWTRR